MKRVRYFVKNLWTDEHLAQWITTIVIMVNVGLSMAIIGGGKQRFTVPSYQPLIDYSYGHTWIWGVIILGAGVLMSTPFKWPNVVGLWLGMVWHIVWMACFMIAATQYDTAAATPIPMYAGVAMISAALLTARITDKNGG